MTAKMEQTSAKSTNPTLSVDKTGYVLYSNEAGNLLLNEWGARIGEKLPSSIVDLVQRIISRNSPEKIEVKVGNKLYLVVFSPLHGQECVSISGFDISDHREQGEETQQSEERLKALMDHNPSLVFMKDEFGRYVYLNKSYEKQFVHSKDWYGKTDFDFWPKKSAELFRAHDYHVLKSGQTHQFMENSTDLNGTRYCWLNYKFPFTDSKNKKYVGGIGIDATNFVRAEESLNASENLLFQAHELLEAVTKGTNVIIATIDKNFRYTYFNKSYFDEVKRLSGKEIYIGASMIETFAQLPEQQKIVVEEWSEVLEGKSTNKTLTFGEAGIYRRIYNVLHTPILNAEGNIVGAGEVANDITEKVSAKESLLESEVKFRTLFNSIDEGICIVEVIVDDSRKPVDLLILDYNSVFQQRTGFRFDIKGRNIRSVFTSYEEQWVDTIGEVALTGKSVRFENYFQSLNRWYNSFVTRIGGEGSLRVAIVFDDITKRKLDEEAIKQARNKLEEKVKERTEDLQKAYNSLKESEKRLAEAQEMAHIGNWEWDIATYKIYWSEEMYRIFKRDPQILAPSLKEYYGYIHPDDLDYYCKVTDNTRKVSPSGFDFRIVLANGEERTLHLKSDFIYNDENIPIRVKGTVQDITESKKAEEKIRYFANIVESSQDAIGTISLDGIITSWNKGAEKVYGYSTEEILGKHVSILSPSHLENETMKLIEPIKQGESYYHFETLRLGKNGKEIYVSVTYSPIFDTNGKLTAISIIGRDITEYKRAEEKLRESEEKYRNIVETANEGILTTDNENNITYVNQKLADMLLYNAHEIIGKSIWFFICEEYIPIVQMNLEKRRKGEYGSYELKLKRKDGSPLWIILNVKPLFDKEGKYIGAMSMLTDITERKKTEEALKNFEIAQKKEIHHRIKNNLQVISSLLDLQADLFRGRENIKDSEVMKAFKQSIDRVLSIALIHEELYKGKNIELLNFSQYVKELAENLLLTYKLETDINFIFDLEENIFLDMDTAIPLGIVINELVTNSFKYAFSGRDKGEIRVKLHRDESEGCNTEGSVTTITLSVSNNGIGISGDLDIEDLDSLGLHLVTTLVDQLDGELELKRDNGTEFIIRFTVMKNNNQGSDPQLINNGQLAPSF